MVARIFLSGHLRYCTKKKTPMRPKSIFFLIDRNTKITTFEMTDRRTVTWNGPAVAPPAGRVMQRRARLRYADRDNSMELEDLRNQLIE